MRAVARFQTFDGVEHTSRDEAERYLVSMHAAHLGNISRGLCALDAKYVATGDWVDANLALFLKLNTIKQDMRLVDTNNLGETE